MPMHQEVEVQETTGIEMDYDTYEYGYTLYAEGENENR
jgi:hypothetical protein